MATKKNWQSKHTHSLPLIHTHAAISMLRCSKYTLQKCKGINKTKRKMLLSCSRSSITWKIGGRRKAERVRNEMGALKWAQLGDWLYRKLARRAKEEDRKWQPKRNRSPIPYPHLLSTFAPSSPSPKSHIALNNSVRESRAAAVAEERVLSPLLLLAGLFGWARTRKIKKLNIG